MIDTTTVTAYISDRLVELGDAEKAKEMAAYMKTEMPFYGVPSPERKVIFRDARKTFLIKDNDSYREIIQCLWRLPHREEKYIALNYAEHYKKFILLENLDLYEHFIRTGAWWDFVDTISNNCIGYVFKNNRKALTPLVRTWNEDDDLWMRRVSIICQLKHKKETDEELLFEMCEKRMHEKNFFIRKAIGWALREYSKYAADAVIEFLDEHKDELSPLSFREGARILIKNGQYKK